MSSTSCSGVPYGTCVVIATRYSIAAPSVRPARGAIAGSPDWHLEASPASTTIKRLLPWQLNGLERHCPLHEAPPSVRPLPRCAGPWGDQAALVGQDYKLGPVPCGQLAKDAADVRLGGQRADK